MLVARYDPTRRLREPSTWTYGVGPDHVMLKCPNGHIGILDHAISDGGVVRPSVVCPHCDFHDWVILQDWHDSAFPERGEAV